MRYVLMVNKGMKVGAFLYRTGNWVVRIIGSLIFLILTWYSFRYTYYMQPLGEEISKVMHDSMLWNLLGLAAAFAVFAMLIALEKHTDSRTHLILRRASAVVSVVWVGIFSFWWIFSADRVPEGDQAFIYGGASMFMEGNYDFLSAPGAYCGKFPYQLGLMALVEILFRVVGAYNYQAFQYLSALLAMGIVYLGYRVVSELTDRTATVVGYNILMMGCLPLIFYTPWVYGDIPSIFCGLLAVWMIQTYCKKGKKRYLAVLVCALVLSMLVRKNSLLLLVAIAITAFLYALRKNDWKVLTALLLAAVLSFGTYQGIYKMYEIRSGYEHYDGIPIIAWTAMGMQEMNGRYGWYNDYTQLVAYEHGYDKELTTAAVREDIKERLQFFKENPEYARFFFREKILSQWDDPLYQSAYFNTRYEEGAEPGEGSLADKVGGDSFFKVLAVSDRWQAVVFFGMLCYFVFAVKGDSNLLQHVLAVTLIGEFLFSVIHEAMSRYIFSYYVMMFPYAVYGMEQAVKAAVVLAEQGQKRRNAGKMVRKEQ